MHANTQIKELLNNWYSMSLMQIWILRIHVNVLRVPFAVHAEGHWLQELQRNHMLFDYGTFKLSSLVTKIFSKGQTLTI